MKVIIAGGGTGGHLFPGIALAQELKQQVPEIEILFLCTRQPFDKEQLDRYGFKYQVLPGPRISVSLSFPINLLRSLAQSWRTIRQFNPRLVIGVGGYGAFGPLVMAKTLGIRFVLLEQNVLPGKVTRLLSLLAHTCCLQWAASRRYFTNCHTIITGSPLRQGIKRINRNEACQRLELNPNKKILTIIGGSQGAQALNNFCIDNMTLLKEYKDRLAIIHLTGQRDYERVKKAYATTGIETYLASFCRDMSLIYSAADLVLSRAGGIALAEMLYFGLPMVLVPYPYAAEDHQYFNALEVQKTGAGIIIRQKDLTTDKIRFIIEKILLQPERLNQMTQQIQNFVDIRPEQAIVKQLIKTMGV